jgi:hypothetical protein
MLKNKARHFYRNGGLFLGHQFGPPKDNVVHLVHQQQTQANTKKSQAVTLFSGNAPKLRF